MAKKKALARVEKKILITGGTGFLGAHIVRQLLGSGTKNLRVMASSVPEWMQDAGVEAAEGSVTNREDVAKAVEGVTSVKNTLRVQAANANAGKANANK